MRSRRGLTFLLLSLVLIVLFSCSCKDNPWVRDSRRTATDYSYAHSLYSHIIGIYLPEHDEVFPPADWKVILNNYSGTMPSAFLVRTVYNDVAHEMGKYPGDDIPILVVALEKRPGLYLVHCFGGKRLDAVTANELRSQRPSFSKSSWAKIEKLISKYG